MNEARCGERTARSPSQHPDDPVSSRNRAILRSGPAPGSAPGGDDGPGADTLRSVGGAELLQHPDQNVRLLLVEDNPGDARLVREALAEARATSVEVVRAETLASALGAVHDAAPDIILLDLGLPDSSGLETLHALITAAPQVPIVVLTGLNDEEVALQTLRAGAQDYLEKGEIAGPALARALRYALERKRLQKVERFISGAAQLLGSSLRLEDTLGQLADLSVAHLADFCVVDLQEPDGRPERLLVAHREESQREVAEQLRVLTIDRERPHLAREVAIRRVPVRVEEVEEEHLAALAQNESHARLLRALRIRSYMAIPLLASSRLVGILVLISSTRPFTAADLEVSLRFADIAAAAILNARLYEESAEALRTRDRVLGVVAHDLRNPLSTIAMSAELLLENALPELQRRKQLDLVRRSAYRMNRLIEDLLDIARIEHGSLTLEFAYHHPDAIVHEVIEANSSLASARDLALVPTVEAPGPVLVDYDRLLQLLGNLIGNSVKFTPGGGEIRIGANQLDDHVLFFVSDTGPGIPEPELEQLFRPFWQGRGRKGEGVGLGLSIARGIVEAHGGRIWAKSGEGEGTTMYLTIPLARERRSTDPA